MYPNTPASVRNPAYATSDTDLPEARVSYLVPFSVTITTPVAVTLVVIPTSVIPVTSELGATMLST